MAPSLSVCQKNCTARYDNAIIATLCARILWCFDPPRAHKAHISHLVPPFTSLTLDTVLSVTATACGGNFFTETTVPLRQSLVSSLPSSSFSLLYRYHNPPLPSPTRPYPSEVCAHLHRNVSITPSSALGSPLLATTIRLPRCPSSKVAAPVRPIILSRCLAAAPIRDRTSPAALTLSHGRHPGGFSADPIASADTFSTVDRSSQARPLHGRRRLVEHRRPSPRRHRLAWPAAAAASCTPPRPRPPRTKSAKAFLRLREARHAQAQVSSTHRGRHE